VLTNNRGEITAIIDWDECAKEWFVYELARSVWEFCHNADDHKLDLDKANAFIWHYKLADGPVPAKELQRIVPFVRCVRLLEVLFYLDQAFKGQEGYPEYTRHNVKALVHLTELESLYGKKRKAGILGSKIRRLYFPNKLRNM
jgi:Ser/Thr protein kinase RdoA (MazF antagonist)